MNDLPDNGVAQLELMIGAIEQRRQREYLGPQVHVLQGARALHAYGQLGTGTNPVDTMTIDLLADLRHLCAALHLDFDELAEHSARTFAGDGH